MEKIIEDLEIIQRVFDAHKVRLIIGYGLLLGMYRDKKPLPDDDDIDICVVDKLDYQTKKDIGWELYGLGFKPQMVGFNVCGRIEIIEAGFNGDKDTGIIVCQRNFKFTIFFFKEEMCEYGKHGREYVCIPKYGALRLISIPVKFFHDPDTIKINRKKYLTPSPIEEYLQFVYYDWKDKTLRNHGELYYPMHNIELKEEMFRK